VSNDKADAAFHGLDPDAVDRLRQIAYRDRPTVVERKVVVDLCHLLGYDPSEVAAITITPSAIEVTRYHYLVDSRTAAEREADRHHGEADR
jgi:hypothetical protein